MFRSGGLRQGPLNFLILYINVEPLYEHLTYKVPQKLVNVKHSLVLTGMLRFTPASQLVERYHSVAVCAVNMEDLIQNNFL
jgi:hypothetical protein